MVAFEASDTGVGYHIPVAISCRLAVEQCKGLGGETEIQQVENKHRTMD